jgi:hypothetical protein
MAGNLKKEFAVLSRVEELIVSRPAGWKAAKDEGPGIECQFLLAILALLANELNSLHLSQAAL